MKQKPYLSSGCRLVFSRVVEFFWSSDQGENGLHRKKTYWVLRNFYAMILGAEPSCIAKKVPNIVTK